MFRKNVRFFSQNNHQLIKEQEEKGPLCPKCGDEMTKKKIIKGPKAGKPFWGCITFPECKGILKIIE